MSYTSELHIECVDTVDGFDRLQETWKTLLEQSGFPNAFIQYDWCRAWWDIFGQDKQLCILVVKRAESTLGIAPFMQVDNIVRFIGWPDTDYSDFIAKENRSVVYGAMDYLMQRPDWSRIELAQLNEQSDSAENLIAWLKDRQPKYIHDISERCLTLNLDDELRSKFRLKRSKSLKNQINYFKKNGGLELKRLESVKEMDSILSSFFNFHVARWEETPTPSKFRESKPRDFVQQLILRLGPDNSVVMFLLEHKDRPIAFFLGFRRGAAVYLYTPSHNPYYHRRSPGKVLNYLLVEQLVKQQFSVIDYTRGEEGYKNKFTNTETVNHSFTCYSSTLPWLKAKSYRRLKSTGLVRSLAELKIIQRLRTTSIASVLKALGRFLVSRQYSYSVTLNPRLEVESRLTFSELSGDDMDLIGSVAGLDEKSPDIQRYARWFEEGRRCFGMDDGGALVAYFWQSTRGDSTVAVFTDFACNSSYDTAEVLLDLTRQALTAQSLDGPATVHLSDERSCTIDTLRNRGHSVRKTLRDLSVFGIKLKSP